MAYESLPRAIVTETDVTSITLAGGTLPALFLATADRGPVGEPTYLVNTDDFIKIFGKPRSLGSTFCFDYLSAGQPVIFVRTFNPDFMEEN